MAQFCMPRASHSGTLLTSTQEKQELQFAVHRFKTLQLSFTEESQK